MNFENLKLNYLYQTFSPFKESEISNINNLIAPSRIGKCIKFKCYGHACFDNNDLKHEKLTVKELNNFERKNTNVVVFEVIDEKCKDTFTELFLYHTLTPSQSSYGLVSYNSTNDKLSHKIQIDYNIYDLVIALNKSVMRMQNPNPFD